MAEAQNTIHPSLLALGLEMTEAELLETWNGTDSDEPPFADKDFETERDYPEANYRFMRQDLALSVLAEELKSDPYVLGCFKAEFLATVTDWPAFLIEAAQKGEQFEAIGQALIDGDFVDGLAQAYAEADGYGHHFAHYDHQTQEFTGKDGEAWYCFRTN